MKNVKKSKPVFKISSPTEADELWEQVIDFTKIRKGGINIGQLFVRRRFIAESVTRE